MNIFILTILLLIPAITNATSWKIDDLYTFTTSTNGSAGIVDADSVPTYRIYEDETGTAVLTGSMAKLDDAGTTGFYSEQVTLSAANGFEKGKSYNIIICAAISSTIACATEAFQVEMEVDSNTVSGTVPTVTNVTNAVLISDGTGAGQIDTLNGSIVNVDLADTCTAVTNGVTLAATATSPQLVDDIWDELATGHTGAGKAGQQLWTDIDDILADTADMQPKLGTPVTSVSGDIATVLARTPVLKQITVSAGTTVSAIISTGSFTESSNKGYVGGVVNCPNATATENRPVFLKIISFDPATDKVTLNGSFPTVLTTGDVCNVYIDTVR